MHIARDHKLLKVHQQPIAIWVITPNGARLAMQLQDTLPNSSCFCIASPHVDQVVAGYITSSDHSINIKRFTRLRDEVTDHYHRFRAHIFIMATGIVVRMLAPLIQDKSKDPAVVVVDDLGKHCISLLSGHIGGANQMTLAVAERLGANPVITTATDINQVPAIDTLAAQAGLVIENPKAIKCINMAFLTGSPIHFQDRDKRILPQVPEAYIADPDTNASHPRVIVDHHVSQSAYAQNTLLLRPPTLVAGMGCNRNTGMEEMQALLLQTLEKHSLSRLSLCRIATVDIKNDEQGFIDLARELSLPLEFFTRDQLKAVETIQTPSKMVEKHIGVPSVCEAAAILGARQGQLIVPKTNSKNVTVAIASQCST